MKTVHKLLGLVLILGLVPFSLAMAQTDDAEMPMEDMALYEDANGVFTVEYPAEFFAYPNFFGMDETFPPFLNVVFDDSEVDLDSLDTLPEADGVSIGIIFYPRPFLPEMGGLSEDATVEEFSEAMVAIQSYSAGWAEDEAELTALFETITIETITLADGSEAAQVDFPYETEDNLVTFFEASEDVIGFVSIQTEPGARTEELETLYTAIIESLEFTGTADDVLMMDMGMGMDVDMMDTALYEDANGLFTVEYPAEFFAYPNLFTFPPFLNVVFEDDELDLDEFDPMTTPADGVSIGVIFWPRPFFPEMGGFPEDIPVEAFGEAIVVDRASGMVEDEAEREALLETITVETITLADGSEAALVTYPEETEDLIIAFFDASEDVIAFVSLATEPGARTEELEALHMAVVNSLAFTGTADDVLVMELMDMATEEASD